MPGFLEPSQGLESPLLYLCHLLFFQPHPQETPGERKQEENFHRHKEPARQSLRAAGPKDVHVCGFFRSLGRFGTLLEATETRSVTESPSSYQLTVRRHRSHVSTPESHGGKQAAGGSCPEYFLLFLPFRTDLSRADPHQSSSTHNPTGVFAACFHIFSCIPT